MKRFLLPFIWTFKQDIAAFIKQKVPDTPVISISKPDEPSILNLWCFRSMVPSAGKEEEIVIRRFEFTPAL